MGHRRCHAGGRANIWSTLKKAGLVHEGGEPLGEAKWRERSAAILERVKRLENLGYSFEGAEASVHLMLLHASPGYCSPFTVLDYSVTTSDENMGSASRAVAKGGRKTAQRARATVKVRIADGDDEDRLDVAEGSGPVDALAAALVRSLAPTFPFVDSIRLVDYKVRILDPHSATRAATRVECSRRRSRARSGRRSVWIGTSSPPRRTRSWTVSNLGLWSTRTRACSARSTTTRRPFIPRMMMRVHHVCRRCRGRCGRRA